MRGAGATGGARAISRPPPLGLPLALTMGCSYYVGEQEVPGTPHTPAEKVLCTLRLAPSTFSLPARG